MQDFILEYDELESIAKYSKFLGKQAEEYAESLGSSVKNAIGNVTGGPSGYLMSASDSVSDKMVVLKQKSDAFYHFAEQISNLLEVAERMDQEVADAIIAQREYFLEHHESLRIENWKTKLLDLLVDMKISASFLSLIADILNGLDTVLKSSKDTIKDWYKGEGKKTAEAGKDVKLDWEFIYGRTNLWTPPDLKSIGENGKVDLKSTIKQEYKATTNSVTEASAYDWDWTLNIGTDDWMNKPAKKDPFDKMIDFLGKKLFGIEPREKTQADQLFSSFYMGLQFDQQQVASEFSEGLADTMKSAASYDAMIESELPVNSIPVMPNNKINSMKGMPKADSLTGGEDGLDSVGDAALKHSSQGDFTYNPKTGDISKMKSGGHGQANIDFMDENGIEYNIEKTYENGVRVGNVPSHKVKAKRIGTNQSWFPESWTESDIAQAGEYVGNLPGNKSVEDGVITYGEYKGVRVGVIRTDGKISTVFPDATCQP